MQDNTRKFIARPLVHKTNVKSKVTITPLRSADRFDENAQYKLFVVSMTNHRDFDGSTEDFILSGKNGNLEFEYTFKNECEYELRFCRIKDSQPVVTTWDANILHKTSVYAVDEDLYKLRPLKGDMHIHTNRSDGKNDPCEVAANYRRYGFDFIVITDHNRYFPSIEAQEAYKDVKIDLTILNGEEVHTPTSNLHIVHIGGKKSVAELYVKHRQEYEEEAAEIQKTLPDGIYAERLAKAMWATKKIHEAEGLAILPHPFWIKNTYNLHLPFLEALFKKGGFDAFEICGGMKRSGDNLSVAYFNDLRATGFKMPVVSSSDSHINETSARFNMLYSIVFAKDNSRESILEAVKNGLSAAVEHTTQGEQPDYHVYAPFRLVMYTRFLLEFYFGHTVELCETEGLLMRQYTLGVKGAKEALEILQGTTDRFYEYCFGRTANSFYNLTENQAKYQNYNNVWKEYGVERRGSAIDPGIR